MLNDRNVTESTEQSATSDSEARFAFGENWNRFLELLDDDRILAAEKSLQQMLSLTDLRGKRFLDIGSGSGLFSLAARNMGATVHSFDYDVKSVECAQELKRRYYPGDGDWKIERGDILDSSYLQTIQTFDVVYSWGVLHHTGDMWAAMANASNLVSCNGQLYIAIYNDQGWLSTYWRKVKGIYNRNQFGRLTITTAFTPYFFLLFVVRDIVHGSRVRRRGMDQWRDVTDWLGGLPFQVARPENVLEFFRARGFVLDKMTTVGGRHGCNEFVLRKIDALETC